MLRFIFSSISFKPTLDKNKFFYFTVTTFDGTIISTEQVHYDSDTNVAVFSEILEIKPYISHKTNLIILELFQQDDQSPALRVTQNSPIKCVQIAKRVLEVNSESIKEFNSKPITLRTSIFLKGNTPLDCNLKLGITIVKDITEKESPKEEEMNILKPFLNEMLEFSQHQKGEFEFLKANSINNDYVKKITPIVYITNYLSDVLNWKSPMHTLIFGLTITIITLYFQIVLALGLILFYINTPFFLRMLTKIPKFQEDKNLSLFERNKRKLYKLKRNITHIQETQKDYIKKYDYFKKLIFTDDRTSLIELILSLRKYVLCILPFLLMFPPLTCFLIAFWLCLFRKSAYGKSLLEELQGRFEQFNDQINKKIDYFVHRFRIFPIPPEVQSEFRKESDQISQKTFVIYENQRWWLGKGWTDLLLPGERAKYSDIEGISSLDFKKVKLPEPENLWVWESEWEIEKNERTDDEGWEYSYDFKNEFHPKNSKLDYARRRKWFRRCSKLQGIN